MRSTLVIAVLSVAGGLTAAGAAAYDQTVIPYLPGDPLTNGCPTSFEALDLSELAPYGYRVPFAIDSTADGGNGDGIICGTPFEPEAQAAAFPNAPVPVVFHFMDNKLASELR